MKFNIMRKLFIVVALPVVTLLLFSANYIDDKFSKLQNAKIEHLHLRTMQSSSNLLHELQIERGLSSSYLTNPNEKYFINKLKKHREKTDERITPLLELFNTIDKRNISKTTKKYIQNLVFSLKEINIIRDVIDKQKIKPDKSFRYYSLLNQQLIAIFKGLRVHSHSKNTGSDIIILNKLIEIQELAGKERALLSNLFSINNINTKDLRLFYRLVDSQKELYSQINFLLKDTELENHLKNINNKYKKSFFSKIRKDFLDYEIKKNNISKDSHRSLNTKKWIKVSTDRINDIHSLENKLFQRVSESFINDITDNKNLLIIQIILIFVIVSVLLFSTFIISKNITLSIQKLGIGIDYFFQFLHSNGKKVQQIETNSNDEINDMAQSINTQMRLIEKNLAADKDFINEATQIVTLMKDGDFSERVYFEPNNPNLLELKSVLDELINLISEKIKEQTDSLEELNRSLEERVHQQTLELEEQIKEITISRDKAIQAEIAKDEFLANMSHEIRTPLNAILGFVTILKKQVKEEDALKYLNIIDASGKSLLTIINDILDFSKIQSGKFTISPHAINPVEEMSNTVLLFASKAYEKHLLYSVYIDPNLPQNIKVDVTRVKQIFSNILSNAIKFTPEDGEIDVKVIYKNSKLTISIKDNGIGIAQENITKVFKAFEQADGSTTRKYGGTGLGLSISYKLAQLMNGDLSVSSKEGEGSTFTLNVPVKILNNEPKLLIDKEKIENTTFALLSDKKDSKNLNLIEKYLKDFGAKNIIKLNKFQTDGYDLIFFIPDDEYNEDIIDSNKAAIAILRNSAIKLADLIHIQALYTPFTPNSIIQTINDSGIDKIIEQTIVKEEEDIQFIGFVLIAEDNKTNQMLISLILDDYGLEYNIANDGVEAVEMFKNSKYDLVLMDENMPKLNGIGAMKQIREYENKNSLLMTPILALTASVLDTDKKMFIDAGMDGFVGKPIDTNELESQLSKFLKKR